MKVRNRAIGSVCELVAHGAGKYITEFAVESKDGSEIATYSTIEELLEYWGTYKPTEPLIKDEKIRKAVRAWAEANDIERVWHEKASCWLRGNGLAIEMENEVFDLEQGNFSIAELCGEEEEWERNSAHE